MRSTNRGRLSGRTAFLAVGGVLALGGLLSRRYSPDPSHPRVFRWYKSLDTPPLKPPDLVFGAIWPVLQGLVSVGAYRLMRAPKSPPRDQALALWAANIVLVTAYATIVFGRRSLSGGVAASGLLVLGAAAFVERAARVDRAAALTGVPFALWSAFGGLLTESLRERNPDLDGDDP